MHRVSRALPRSLDLRRHAAAVVAITALGLSACDKPITTSPVKAAARPSLDASPTSNQILIDNFTDGGGTVGGPWYGYWVQNPVNGAIGGVRELGSYNYGKIVIDPVAGTMEWGIQKLLSPQFSASYGTGIGQPIQNGSGFADPNAGTGPALHLSLTPQDQIVVDFSQLTSNEPLKITVVAGNGEPFYYNMPMPATIPETGPVELTAPLSGFISEWNNQPITAAATADIDGFSFWQHGDGLDGIGGTIFTKISVARAQIQTEFTSGSGVTAYDPLPGGTDNNWGADVCTTQPSISKDDPRWVNPHPAYVLDGHPWAGTIADAPWINAWNSLSETAIPSLYPNGGFVPVPSGQYAGNYFNWSKYTTTVSGNGTFQLDLLADNCSWVYLDNTLVGVQGTDLSKHSYGVTLNGTATLTFLIFDGGGLAGGQFRLVTTTNPPPPLVVDNTAPVVTPTVTGTKSTSGWYTDDVKVTWSVTDPDSPINNKTGCDETDITTNTTADGQIITCTATSAGGTTKQSVTILRDATVPTVSGAVTSGTLGANGWYTSDVGVTWTPSAAGPSGQTLSSDCSKTTLGTDAATYTFTCTVTTGAGVASTQGTVTVKRDAQTPTIKYAITGTQGANGWYVGNVGVVWTTTAGPSGVNTCTSAPVTADGTGITFSCTATAGNGKSANVTTAPVNRDATLPTVAYSGNAGSYTVDQKVNIVCTPSDNLSGVASSTCQNIAGDGYVFALGANSYSATATDKAGNVSATATTSFTMSVTQGSLCALVTRWSDNGGIANSLCVKLAHGDYDPFRNELSAQSGKHIAADKAAILLRLVNAL